MGFLFGRGGIVLLVLAALGVGAWRLRAARRSRLDLEWEAEIAGAIDEGRAAAPSEP